MNKLIRAMTLLAGMGAGMGLHTSAHAVIMDTVKYNITANCVDCAEASSTDVYTVTAQLTLKNYTLGQQLSSSNFVSFFYGGSNLLNPYSVTLAEQGGDYIFDTSNIFGLLGAISEIPGENTVFLSVPNEMNFVTLGNDGGFFGSQPSGYWFTCVGATCDLGGSGSGSFSVSGSFFSDSSSVTSTNDYGNNASFSIPEPNVLALMLVGLSGFALTLRRRNV